MLRKARSATTAASIDAATRLVQMSQQVPVSSLSTADLLHQQLRLAGNWLTTSAVMSKLLRPHWRSVFQQARCCAR
jgi:hypothetical protein